MARRNRLLLLFLLGLITFGMVTSCAEAPPPPPPSTRIEALAQATTMTNRGKRSFYENRPTIEKKKNFLNLCKHTEKTIVLGCYSNQRQIYLQDIQDKRLKGVMEVTAAHEMLHDIYEHLLPWERSGLNKRLKAAFDRVQNPRIIKLVDSYRQQSDDDKVLLHELHSILGTEVRDLGDPELEAHYAKYFQQRKTVVAFSEQYEATFNKLHADADRLKKSLTSAETELNKVSTTVKANDGEIANESQEMAAMRDDLERLRQQDQSLAAQGQSNYSLDNEFEQKKAQFNAKVPLFNERVDAHRARVGELKEKVAQYNDLVKEYNAIAQEENSLIDVLKSEAAPAKSTHESAKPH
jgi:chromosome segregation ATPase